jgi:ADP-ribose pyrophosphatase
MTEPASVSMADAVILKTEVIVPGPKRFVREVVQMPDGYEIDWFYIDTPPSVLIVPVTGDGSVVMVRQWRHNLRRHTLEFPAGTVCPGESLEDAVLAADAVPLKLGSFCSLPSETNKYTNIFLAQPVVLSGPATGDAEIERYFDMSVEVRQREDVLAVIGTEVIGTETTTAFMLAERVARADSNREASGNQPNTSLRKCEIPLTATETPPAP